MLRPCMAALLWSASTTLQTALAGLKGGGAIMAVWSGRYCPPRHRMYIAVNTTVCDDVYDVHRYIMYSTLRLNGARHVIECHLI